MYDKNQIEDSLEFVRQIKDLYDSDDSLDAFDPLEDNDTDELFANLAYNMERNERPWENVLQGSHSTGAGFGSSETDIPKQGEERQLSEQAEIRKRQAELAEQKRIAEERRQLEEEKERRRIAEEREQRRLAEERQRLEEEKERRRIAEEREQRRLAEERQRLEEEKERRRIAEQEEQKRQAEERKKIEAERKRLLEEQKRQEEERHRLEEERQRLVEERLQRELAEQKRRIEEQAKREAEGQKRRQQMVLAEQKRRMEEQAKREAEEQARRQAEEAEQKRRMEEQAKREAEEQARRQAEQKRRMEEQARRQAEEAEQKRRQQILAEEQRREAELVAEQKRQAEERIQSPGDAEVMRLQKRAEELQRQAEMASLEARMRQLQLESQTARGENVAPGEALASPNSSNNIPMPMLSIPGVQPGAVNIPEAQQKTVTEGASADKRKLSKEEIDNLFAKELKKVPQSDSSYQQRKEMLQKQAERLRQKREEVGDTFPLEKLREKALQTKDVVFDYVWKLRDIVVEKTTDPENEESRAKAKKILTNVLVVMVCIFVAFILASVVTSFVAHPTKVEGESMETTLTDGDTVIIQKMSYYFGSPERYDVVVFPVYNSDTYYIKRVIGLPGETVQIEEGKVFINGKELEDDTYGKDEYIDDPGDAAEPITLASDEYFVLGDNRNMSTDSRNSYVGVIKKRSIAGKAWKRVLPFSKFGSIKG